MSGVSNVEENRFPIPAEYQSVVRFSPSPDTRTDDEILAFLNQHHPVTSERNVWGYWHSGIMTMPAWQKRNVCDWVRLCGPRWKIRILDKVPESPNYAFKHIAPELLPQSYQDNTMHGPYVGQHSADFLRGAALWSHGGVWTDVGQILFMSFDRICWNMLEDPSNPYSVCAPLLSGTMVANWFISARKGDPFIKRWHDVFMACWENRTTHTGVSEHPLIKNSGVDINISPLAGSKVPFTLLQTPVEAWEYGLQMLCWMRVASCEGSEADPFSGADYWRNNVLLYDAMLENNGVEMMIPPGGDPGRQTFDILRTKLDADPESAEYRLAHSAIWNALARSSTQKVGRAKNVFKHVNLGTYWDQPENQGSDRAPGTFAELMRYGAVNFSQLRDHINYVPAPEPPVLLKKAALEP